MPRRAFVVGSLAVPALFASSVLAQSAAREEHAPTGTMIGLSVGLPGYENHAASEFLVLGLDILKAKPAQPGLELSLGTVPRLLSGQAVVFGGRLDAVFPLAVSPDFWLTPSGGGSLIGGASSDVAGAFAGVNAGVGAIAWSGHVGLRANVTLHHFLDTRGVVWLAELGFVEGR